jgi:hypothetical protein
LHQSADLVEPHGEYVDAPRSLTITDPPIAEVPIEGLVDNQFPHGIGSQSRACILEELTLLSSDVRFHLGGNNEQAVGLNARDWPNRVGKLRPTAHAKLNPFGIVAACLLLRTHRLKAFVG